VKTSVRPDTVVVTVSVFIETSATVTVVGDVNTVVFNKGGNGVGRDPPGPRVIVSTSGLVMVFGDPGDELWSPMPCIQGIWGAGVEGWGWV
jgi:hypothetical protein